MKASQIDYDAASPFGSGSPFFVVADANPFSLRERFSAFQSGAYVQATRMVMPRVNATVGARVDHYPFLSATRVSPRLSAANLAISRARYAGFDGVPRPGSFDYPVVANILGNYKLTPAWSLSAKMAYLGGRPITPIDSVTSASQRRSVYDLTRVNAERTPDYFRLDFRVERTFRRDERQVSMFAGAQNVTNRKNFAGYSWDRRNNALDTLEQLGVFPILGIEWPF